jgi:hypothetical protein
MIGLPQQLGIGITAYSKEDALQLIRKSGITQFPCKVEDGVWKEITEMDQLDSKHIVPNAGATYFRGLWYPNLGVDIK